MGNVGTCHAAPPAMIIAIAVPGAGTGSPWACARRGGSPACRSVFRRSIFTAGGKSECCERFGQHKESKLQRRSSISLYFSASYVCLAIPLSAFPVFLIKQGCVDERRRTDEDHESRARFNTTESPFLERFFPSELTTSLSFLRKGLYRQKQRSGFQCF